MTTLMIFVVITLVTYGVINVNKIDLNYMYKFNLKLFLICKFTVFIQWCTRNICCFKRIIDLHLLSRLECLLLVVKLFLSSDVGNSHT